jgi:hypothetical protein
MSTPGSVIAAVKQSRIKAEALSRAAKQRDEDEKLRIKELQARAGETFAQALRMDTVSRRIDEIIEKRVRAAQTKGYIVVRGVRYRGWQGYDEETKNGLEPLLSALSALLSHETSAIREVWCKVAHEWSVERYQGTVRLWVGDDMSICTTSSEHLGLFWKIV